MPEFHRHPSPASRVEEVHGERLPPGAVLRRRDVYPSSGGFWGICTKPGAKVPDDLSEYWVRLVPRPKEVEKAA